MQCAMAKFNQKEKSNGHAVSLAERQRVPREIPYLLETGQAQLCRLLDKAPPSGAPPEHEKRNFNAICGTGDAVIGTKQ